MKTNHRDILLILIASFFYMASPMLVTPLIAGYAADLGAGAALMGIIGGLMNICSLFCRPFVGNLVDKISKYRLSVVGAACMAVACLGYIAAWSPACILAARVVNGIGFSCCSVCMSTWMASLLPRENVGSGMGLYGTMNALAMAIAPAIGVTLYQRMGYKTAFIAATTFAVCTLLIVQFVHNKGLPAAPSTDTQTSMQLVEPKVLPIAVVIMLFAIPYCATQSFLVSYIAAKGLNVTVSLFFPAYAAVLLILRLSLRSLFDKKPFSFFLVGSSGSALISIVLLHVMRSTPVMLLAAAFMAGGYGIMCSVCQSTAILLAGPGKRGLANSTYYIGLDLGMALGPILGGVLYGAVAIDLVYPILAATVPAGIAVYLLSRKTLEQNGSAAS